MAAAMAPKEAFPDREFASEWIISMLGAKVYRDRGDQPWCAAVAVDVLTHSSAGPVREYAHRYEFSHVVLRVDERGVTIAFAHQSDLAATAN